ncbi:hypothetical protein [Occultella gossypii]|uniref:Uncharacterized protein n=1 Tax=Occultella gossypii TaxID=2800820 RepID=A0ABS7S2P7_9MICO|nr:hypothetical protein [Occultella gossypii]MBZ2194610.1 hypothetical protein [Occultella gossypii]
MDWNKIFRKRIEHAQTSADELRNADPEQLRLAQLSLIQGAQGHYSVQDAAALSDPETAAFLMAPLDEQRRQQDELVSRGQRLRELWEHGVAAQATITSLVPTGRVLGGQREFELGLEVESGGDRYAATAQQVVPAPMAGHYAVGGRFAAKVDPGDRGQVGLFEKLG